MPLYRYQCTNDHTFTDLHRSDDEPPECPKCGAREVERVIGRTSFKLEGGGWYVDGYANTEEK